MSDFIDIPVTQMMEEFAEKVAEGAGSLGMEDSQVVDLAYILERMEAIQKDTKYLSEVIDKLSRMQDGDSGSQYAPGNIMGEAKAKAFGDIVRCRETTNQQLLKMYEKMYDDRSARGSRRQITYDLVECVAKTDGIDSEDKRIIISDILKHMAG